MNRVKLLAALALLLGSTLVAGTTATSEAAACFGDSSGKVVRAANGNPVSGVRVTVRDVSDLSHVYGSDYTGRYGNFRIPCVPAEEIGVYVNGNRVGFNKGYVKGNHYLGSWGDAVSWSPMPMGRIYVRRL